jgi:hypothetical protein
MIGAYSTGLLGTAFAPPLLGILAAILVAGLIGLGSAAWCCLHLRLPH